MKRALTLVAALVLSACATRPAVVVSGPPVVVASPPVVVAPVSMIVIPAHPGYYYGRGHHRGWR